MVAQAELVASRVPELLAAHRVAAAEVAEAETEALVRVAKFAFGQLGDRHEKS